MDDKAAEVVARALAGTRWSAHPFPVEYLPALARDVLYALEQARFAVVALPEPDEDGDFPFSERNYLSSCDGEIQDKFANEYGPPYRARRLAGALLAAADVAELNRRWGS